MVHKLGATWHPVIDLFHLEMREKLSVLEFDVVCLVQLDFVRRFQRRDPFRHPRSRENPGSSSRTIPANYRFAIFHGFYNSDVGERNPRFEEIAGALLTFNQRQKASDGSSQGEGLVAKGNLDRGRNKSRSVSSRNKSQSKLRRRKEGYSVLLVWEKGHIK